MRPSDLATPQVPEIAHARCHVISDTHFAHPRIEVYGERPPDHEERMLEALLDLVAPGDVLVHMGDLVLGKPDAMEPYADLLSGIRRKYLVRGNHDKRSRAWYASMGFTVIDPFVISYRGWTVSWTHRPGLHKEGPIDALVRHPRSLNVHGHIHQREYADRRLVNVSVERTDYRPVWAARLLDERIDELEAIRGTYRPPAEERFADGIARDEER